MKASERSRLHFVEAQAKRYKWRSVALVGVSDTGLARQFLAHFPLCKMLVVPIWREDLRPGPAGAQRNFQRNLRIWSKSYGRFEYDPSPPLTVAELTEREFDGVVLWTGIAPELLAVIGGAWVPRVVDGGWLLGVDHRLAFTRDVLNKVAPGWVQYREGIWGVRVRRSGLPVPQESAVGGLEQGGSDVVQDSDATKVGHVAVPMVDDEAAAEEGEIVHDPVDSGSDVDDAVHVAAPDDAGAEGEPSVMSPVGETIARPPRRARIMSELVSLTPEEIAAIDKNDTPPKRRGGRPKGSKNKPKVDAA